MVALAAPEDAIDAAVFHRVGRSVSARVMDRRVGVASEKFASIGVAQHGETGCVAEAETAFKVEAIDALGRRVEQQAHLFFPPQQLLVDGGELCVRGLEIGVGPLEPPDQPLAVLLERFELRARHDRRYLDALFHSERSPTLEPGPHSRFKRLGAQAAPDEG